MAECRKCGGKLKFWQVKDGIHPDCKNKEIEESLGLDKELGEEELDDEVDEILDEPEDQEEYTPRADGLLECPVCHATFDDLFEYNKHVIKEFKMQDKELKMQKKVMKKHGYQ